MEYKMVSKEFYHALKNKQLIGGKCQDCGHYCIPQRQVCPKCHSHNMDVIAFSGKGKLAAYTVIFVPPVEMANAGYDGKNPYCSGVVELVEGPRISAQILDVDLMDPENIKIGTSLSMTTIVRGEDDNQSTFLAFKPN
jgi:uncharacterized OB-fold protein